MKLLTEATKQGRFVLDKIELSMGSEYVTINYIVDYSINYDKTGTSYFSFTTLGVVPELINASRRINCIQIYGYLDEYNACKKYNTVWNISCDMRIEDMDIDGNADDVCQNMYVNLSGDIW